MATTHLASARKMVMELLPTVPKEFHGIVVSAGLMDKTVKVQLGGQRWEKRIKKVRATGPPLSLPPLSRTTVWRLLPADEAS